MATYTSGSISFSGMFGVDVDFEDTIDKLYQIESKQAEQLLEWYSDWEIRRDAFSQVRETLVNLQKTLNTLNSTDKFLVKKGTSSNESVVGVTVGSEAAAGTYAVEVNQLASSSVWSINTGLATKDALVNDSGQTGTFAYTYKGETRTLNVPTGTTLEQLKNIINSDGENLGVRAQLIQSGDEVMFQLSGLDTGADATLEITDTSINGTQSLAGLSLQQTAKWDYAQVSPGVYATNDLTSFISYGSRTEAINTTETPKTFRFDVTGDDGAGGQKSETFTVKLAAGGSLEDLVGGINAAGSGVTAEIVDNPDGTCSLRLHSADSDDIVTVGGGTLEGYSGMIATTNWQTQAGRNAEIRVNNWPSSGWLEVSSNAVTDVVDGLTLNLRAEGKVTVTTEMDTEAIEENVQSFVDAVNEFRTVIMDLTKVTEDSGIDPEYAENQSEMQSGSALTGNYGVQLLSSNLKQAVSGAAKGFSYAQEIEGKMYGDLFNSLSQIGIITDTDESSDTFGLLIINTAVEKDGVAYQQSAGTFTLKEALAKDAAAVATLFSADGEAKSNSTDFAVSSTVKSLTKPGSYDVSYTTDAQGNIIEATINGKDAKIEGSQISLVQTPSSSNSGVATVSSGGLVDGDYMVDVLQQATKSTATVQTGVENRTDPIYTSSADETIDFSYEYNGVTRTVEIASGTTLDALAATLNNDPDNPGVVALVNEDTSTVPPTFNLVLEARDTGANPDINVSVTSAASGSGPLTTAATTQATGENAQYKVWQKGEPEPAGYTSSESNDIVLASGVTMTIQGAGTATLKVQKNNEADGIVLDVYNLTPDSTMTGSLSVRQGKINELLGMLEGSEGILGSKGTLAILENNYDEIMTNIKDKIQKEDERLNKWLRLTKLRFSRLETTLAEYQNLQSTIESQISQLSSGSSS